MDVDSMMKSSSSSSSLGEEELHLDMMTMMMQMEKLPDFTNPNYNFPPSNPPNSVQFLPIPPPQSPDFSNANTFLSSMEKKNSTAAIREMIFRIAAMQPIHIDPESIKPPKRRNVRISKDPQSVAARHRRERISERIRILQRLVPGGTKMDTASMLDEAIHYVKFLKKQVQTLEQVGANKATVLPGFGFNGLTVQNNCNNLGYSKNFQQQSNSNFLGSMQMLR